MEQMTKNAGIAFLCNTDGTIKEVLRDELHPDTEPTPGQAFVDIVDVGSVDKARRFLVEIRIHRAAFDWELNLPFDGQVDTLHFTGGLVEGDILIVGAHSRAEVTSRFYDEMMRINNEQINALRTMMKDRSLQMRHRSDSDQTIYEELSRLNNELVALQRELAKKNAELRVEHERYRIISELVSDYAYAFRVEPDGTMFREWTTEAFVRITGFDLDCVNTYSGWQDLVYPDDVSIASKRIERLLQGIPDISEYRIITKNGRVRWLRDYCKPVWDDKAKRVVRIYGAAQDITERRLAEMALRESEERFRGIVEHSRDGIALVDESAMIVEWNQGMEHITGLKKEEVLNRSYREMQSRLWANDRAQSAVNDRMKAEIERFLQTGEAPWIDQPTENEIRRTDGALRSVQTLTFRIPTSGGYMLGSIARDTTERKAAEDALHKSERRFRAVIAHNADGVIVVDQEGIVKLINPAGERLFGRSATELLDKPFGFPVVTGSKAEIEILRQGGEVVIAEMSVSNVDWEGRPACLASMRDITARKRAAQDRERLIHELDAFAHTVAHDLKNPLNSILGFAETLLEDAGYLEEEEKVHCLEAIVKSAHKLDNIINALLFLARVRQEVEVPMMPLNMAQIVAEVQERLAPTIEGYRATVVVPASDAWPDARGYAPWVEEVWVNYFTNALKYGGRPPRVELGAKVERGTGRVRFWVRDNGAGLTLEEQSRIFIPFTRLNQAKVEGHGLGLSIVQRIVEKLGGEVGVNSEPGEGSVFSFTLPAK